MRFSIIMQSFLGDYPGAAKDRDKKIVRAIDSVINQTFKDWELIIVADGCEKTFDIVEKFYSGNKRISCYFIINNPNGENHIFWDGKPRDIGYLQSKGEFITYLDIDDKFNPNHLETINSNINGHDWVYYNDFIWSNGKWIERPCNIRRIGYNGTSNVCFKRDLDVSWSTYTGYAHDHVFNKQLVTKYKNFTKIKTPGYYVCHLPPNNGNPGYDI